MSIKFSISAISLAALLTLTYSSIAAAEVYKTSKGQVVVTGLTAKQSYPVETVNAKNKTKKLKDKVANTCGEIIVDNAATYKSLVVGTEKIDPTTLTTKEHARCKAKTTTKKVKTKKITTVATPATVTTPTSTPTPAVK
jgi:hypothetical protein